MRASSWCMAFLLAGCVRNTVENRAPIALAGPDQSLFGGQQVRLHGERSGDPEGDALTFRWTQTAGAPVELLGPGTVSPEFLAPSVAHATTLVFQLEVSDGQFTNRSSSSVTVNVADPHNHAPVAKITAPTVVQAGAQVELDGSGSNDSDGDSITFAWHQTGGPLLILANPDRPTLRFAAPIVITADTPYAFELVVSDAKGGRGQAQASVVAQRMTSNRPPVASAGLSQYVAPAAKVALNGSALDPDGDPIASYRWKQTAGAPVALSNPAIDSPSFIAPKPAIAELLSFSLVACDARGAESIASRVNVFVSSAAIPLVQFTKVVSLHAVTRSSIVVFFLTDVPVAATVDYGAHSSTEHRVTETEPSTRHAVALSGLDADTHYDYLVSAGTAQASGTFTTAIDYARAPKPFSFAVVGDARSHSVWKTVAASVLAKNPRFVIQTGDNNDSWGSAVNWADYYAAGKELFANVPVFAAQGNHDTGSNYSVYNLAPQSSSRSELFYAFVFGNAAFVAIDTNGSSSAMTAWVAGALKQLHGGPLFTFHHHPLYSCGSHGSSTSLQSTYQRLFEDSHVTTDYSGHDHALIVWEPVRGVRYVVSGGGGAGLYPLRGCLGPYAQSKFGFMMVDVDGKTIRQTLYDQHGVELYGSGPFEAFGEAANFSNLGALVSY